MKFTVVIPARLASTRLARKVLLDIAGKPLIQHVFERCCESDAERIIIATDHDEIADCARGFGATVCMTAQTHRSGTERLCEVIDSLAIASEEIVVNVQGDEPMLAAANINQVAALMANNPSFQVGTLYSPLSSREDVFDPNVVKVVTDYANRALYFSRAPIPWDRERFSSDADFADADCFKKHIGIYAYRAAFVKQYVQMSAGVLEQLEKLEQLRVLEHGYSIGVAEVVADPGIGVDSAKDLEEVRKRFAAMSSGL